MNGLSLRVSGKALKDNFKSEIPILSFIPSSKTFVKHFNNHNYDDFHNAMDASEQLNFIKLHGAKDDQEFLRFLLAIFFEAPLKHPLKSVCSKLLITKKDHYEEIENIGTRYLEQLLSENCQSSYSNRNDICNSINSCFDNFNPAVGIIDKCLLEIVHFLKSMQDSLLNIIKNNNGDLSPTEKLNYFNYIHNIVRTFVNILQKCSVQNTRSECVWRDLLMDNLYLFTTSEIQMDTKLNASIVYVLITKIFYNESSLFEIMRNGKKTDIKIMSSIESVICFYSAIVNIVELDRLLEFNIDNGTALSSISENSLILSERLSIETHLEPTIILGISRLMLSLSRLISKSDYSEVILSVADNILQFIWSHLEHYITSVKHLTVQILANIIKLSIKFQNKGNKKLSDNIFESINQLSCDSEIKYKGLSILVNESGCNVLLEKNPNLINEMISVVNKINNSSSVVYAFNYMMQAHKKDVNLETLFNIWVQPVCETLKKVLRNENSSKADVYEEILINMIKVDYNLVDHIIKYLSVGENVLQIHNYEDYKILLISLYAARKTAYFDNKKSVGNLWKNIIPTETLNKITAHYDFDICILCLSVIVESHKTTERYTEEDFKIILKFLIYNINVQSPASRQKMISCLKKVIARWGASFDIIYKKKDEKSIEVYKTFIKKLWRFSMNNLFHGANYSRRNASLSLISWCLRLNVDFNSCEYWIPDDISQIKEYLDDSYECNKILAVKILSACPISILKQTFFDDIDSLLKNTIEKASSLKPTDCSTSAYTLELLLQFPKLTADLFDNVYFDEENTTPFIGHLKLIKILIFHLKEELKVAEVNILHAAANGPIYGLLHCVKHILKLVNMREIAKCKLWCVCINEIVDLMIESSHIVGPIVNNDSPEGFLPMDFEEVGNQNVTSQMVLVCAWRSIKEISLILGDLSYRAVSDDKNTIDIINEKQLLKIGDHFITLLSETKHRGAFEQAYVGFAQLCSRLWACKSEVLCRLPSSWLDDLINSISTGNLNNSKLCATRRSAGVPFIVQALVTTELQVTGSVHNFQQCMNTLLKLTSFESRDDNVSVETRTHCLNILRALFKHTALGDFVNVYVADGLITAINGFDGKTWAERNSSTLLYSSLITRVFGVQRTKDSDDLCIRNRMTGRIFFLRYPKLYDFIMEYLKSFESDMASNYLRPSLFPILLLLSRLYPSSLEGTESNLRLVDFIPYLLKCSESPVLKTRQLTAKAVFPLISPDRTISFLKKLMIILTDKQLNINYCHGILLQISRLLRVVSNNSTMEKGDSEEFINLFDQSVWILTNISTDKPCFMTAELYILNLLLFMKKYPSVVLNQSPFVQKIMNQPEIQFNEELRLHFNKEQYSCAMLHFKMHIFATSKNLTEFVKTLIKSLTNPTCEIIYTSLKYVISLYASKKESFVDKFDIEAYQSDVISLFNEDEIATIIRMIEDKQYKYIEILSNLAASDNQISIKELSLCLMSKSTTFDGSFLTNFGDFQSKIKQLVHLSDSENDVFKSHYLKMINRILDEKSADSLQVDVLEKIMLFLYDCSSPVENYDVRMEVANIFVGKFNFFLWELDFSRTKQYKAIMLQLMTVFQLLDDEDISIRYRISSIVINFASDMKYAKAKYISHNLAKEIIVQKYVQLIEDHPFGNRLVFWITLALADGSCNYDEDSDLESQVFDKGEVNTFREDFILTQLCCLQIKMLIQTNVPKEDTDEKLQTILENTSTDTALQNFLKYEKTNNCVLSFISTSQAILSNKDGFDSRQVDKYVGANQPSLSKLECSKIKAVIISILNPYSL